MGHPIGDHATELQIGRAGPHSDLLVDGNAGQRDYSGQAKRLRDESSPRTEGVVEYAIGMEPAHRTKIVLKDNSGYSDERVVGGVYECKRFSRVRRNVTH